METQAHIPVSRPSPRVGVNGGLEHDLRDFFGNHVNLAARVGAAAQGGQVLVSSLLKDLADPILANSALDRLANGAHQLVIDGPSYRAKLAPRPSSKEAPMP